jgi:purine-binding chemotaxis protein CheW
MPNTPFQSACSTTVEVLPFELEGHRFGLLVADVQEVLRAVTVSPLPRAPSAILGVINLRGTLVPVFDIRGRFGLRRRALRLTDALIVVNERAVAPRRPAAIVVELVSVLVTVPTERIEQSRLRSGDAKYVAGVAKLDDGNIIIYDLREFLTDAERVQIDDAFAQVIE